MWNSAQRIMGMIGLLMALAACGNQTAQLVEGGSISSAPLQVATFRVCETTPFSPDQPTGFNNWANAALSSQGVYPVAQDIITLPGSDFNITSWFALGAARIGADLENVVVKMDSCGAWDTLGSSVIDVTGRARITNQQVSTPGRFQIKQQMLADGSAITSTLSVWPAGTHLVVFDIDGTLTTDNGQFIRQQVDPSYVPIAFPGAQAATQAWEAKGYVVLYLTGRPTDASAQTRGWLNNLGFAKGSTHLTEVSTQMLPTNEGVGTFKRDFLKSLLDKGYVVDYAYGNETTDVFAYTGIGLSPNNIFVLGPNAGVSGTQALPNGYTENLPFIASAPAAVQPFSF